MHARPAFGLLAFALVAPMAGAIDLDDRPAEEILREIDAIERPALGPIRDRTAVQAYAEAARRYATARSRLIRELFHAHPDDPRAADLMLERWGDPRLLSQVPLEELVQEAEQVIAEPRDPRLRVAAYHLKASATLAQHRDDPAAALPAVEEFLASVPADGRGASLLFTIANGTKDEGLRNAVEDRILKDFPKSSPATAVLDLRKRRESLGKPFRLDFVDAVGGARVSVEGLKGKVVVVDFWATWSASCAADVPRMKDLYAKYHERGVEFIGVSLDRPEEKGGLAALRTFVAEHGVGWPQYYQGSGWQSEFSASWGVRSIPTVFVVDREGRLASFDARGDLERILAELTPPQPEPQKP